MQACDRFHKFEPPQLTRMEFGKTPASEWNSIDFSLPPDGQYIRTLGEAKKPVKIYTGGAKWGRKEWLGQIYPVGTKEKDFLQFYTQNFSGIELNTTHYQFYPATTIKKWADTAGTKDFKFCAKVPQAISHYGDLGSQKAQFDTDRFLQGILAFGDHLGPVFLQLSERYGPQRKENLYEYLRKWPKDVPLLLEIRHHEWFTYLFRDELFALLHELQIGLIITDVSGRRDCAHMEITSPYTMVRFVGNGAHPTDYKRLDEWADRIHSWLEKDIREIHFYMHQPDELYTPRVLAYFIERLNKVAGLSLEPPKFIEAGGLFD